MAPDDFIEMIGNAAGKSAQITTCLPLSALRRRPLNQDGDSTALEISITLGESGADGASM